MYFRSGSFRSICKLPPPKKTVDISAKKRYNHFIEPKLFRYAIDIQVTKMNKYNTVFQPAEILLPTFSTDRDRMTRWAVIACDQYTSERSYWEDCVRLINGSSSTYDYILPEAYLGTELEAVHSREIDENMKKLDTATMDRVNGMIYLERTVEGGAIRHGLIGKLDLEAYDYSRSSASIVRATEETVLSRIPPRCRVRASATIELPHILILVEDDSFLGRVAERLTDDSLVYDFELMKNGGHVTGRRVEGAALAALMSDIAEYEGTHSDLAYAMGDGNHSLAAAKAHWENVKAETGDMEHPARYALCEITSLTDSSLTFHPIYRILKDCDPTDVLSELSKLTVQTSDEHAPDTVTAVTANERLTLTFTEPEHALTIGTLQCFIDRYVAAHPETTCDYIHGEDTLLALAHEENSIGFLMDVMDKRELFPYVKKHGTLPRKTFSMGEADSKRYYLEARRIVK